MILDDVYKILMLWAAWTISIEFHNPLENSIMTIFILVVLFRELIGDFMDISRRRFDQKELP